MLTIYMFFLKKMVQKNMRIKLFGNPLNPRAHGTFPRFKSGKFPTRCTDRYKAYLGERILFRYKGHSKENGATLNLTTF